MGRVCLAWPGRAPAIACILLIFIYGYAKGQQDGIQRIGNNLKASSSGVDVPGAIFLVNDKILEDGVIFAFSAYFRSDTPLRFQIWRPLTDDPDERNFKLISEYPVVPSLPMEREDTYVESYLGERKCTKVRHGDRLGVYLEQVPTAVAYTFDPSDPTALGQKVDSPTETGKILFFDALVFPYDFSVAAYVVLPSEDPSNVTVADATTGTTVSVITSSLEPTTMEATSSGGDNTVNVTTSVPKDEDVLEAIVDCPKGTLIPARYSGTLPPTVPTPAPTGRPGATGATGRQGPRGVPGAVGDPGQPGAQGDKGDPGDDGDNGLPGDMGGLGGTGATGPFGPPGSMGATGVMGPGGRPGSTGPKGETGQRGLPGPPGPGSLGGPNGTAVPPRTGRVEAVDGLSLLELILIIWLALVSLILFIVLIILCACLCSNRDKRRKYKQEEDNRRYGNGKHVYGAAYDNASFDPPPKMTTDHGGNLFVTPSQENLGPEAGEKPPNTPAGSATLPNPDGRRVSNSTSRPATLARAYSGGGAPHPSTASMDSAAGVTAGNEWMGSMREEVFTEYAVDTMDRDARRPPKPSFSTGTYQR